MTESKLCCNSCHKPIDMNVVNYFLAKNVIVCPKCFNRKRRRRGQNVL